MTQWVPARTATPGIFHRVLERRGRRRRSTRRSMRSSISFVTSRRLLASISTANVMIVNPSVPAKTVPDFIACAKANPRKVNMASGGTGTPSHIAGELFKMMTGIDMLHVPYRGGAPALTDLMGGQVQVYFGPITASFEAVFNQSSIFAGIMDLQGRLREVNNLAVDWCGYTREQVLDRPSRRPLGGAVRKR